MASPTARVTFRVILAILVILVVFYVGRPLYWKLSATIHDIRHNKQTVSGGISQIVYEAQKSVGWFHDESDSGVLETKHTARRMLRQREWQKWERFWVLFIFFESVAMYAQMVTLIPKY